MPGDDYMFMMKMPTDGSVGTESIDSLNDFIESQINIFYTCHYRIVVHSVLQFFLMLPSWIFDLTNTLVFLIIARLVIPRKGSVCNYPALYFSVLLFIWVFHIDLANGYFWTTGALNYSWTLIPLMYFVRSLVNYIDNNQIDKRLLYLSPLVASSNENALISLFVVTSLLTGIHYMKNKKWNKILFFSALVLLLGGLLMIISPSATARMAREGFEFDNLFARIFEFSKRSAFYIIMYAPVLAFFIMFKKRILVKRKSNLWLATIIGFSFLSMFVAPIFEIRSAVFGFMVSIFLILNLLKDSKGIALPFLLIILSLNFFVSFDRLKAFQGINLRVYKNKEKLKSQVGQDIVALDKQCVSHNNSAIICYEIDESQTYINESLAHYYGVNRVKLRDALSRKHQIKLLKESLDKNGYGDFEKIDEYISIRESEEGMHILIDLGTNNYPKDIITILRGKRKGSLKHFFVQLLPQSLQLYLLDFLEYTGDYYDDGKSILIEGKGGHLYAYQLVYDPENYDYYLWSSYSLNNHTHLGAINRLVFD